MSSGTIYTKKKLESYYSNLSSDADAKKYIKNDAFLSNIDQKFGLEKYKLINMKQALNLYGKYIQTYADNLKSFATLLGNAQKDRYASLNIKNAFSLDKNTIELRIPNGTLEFNELNLNIILFTRIMQKSKYFSHNTDDKKLLKELLFLSKDKRDWKYLNKKYHSKDNPLDVSIMEEKSLADNFD